MTHKITWKQTNENGPFDPSEDKVTIVRWEQGNFAIFLNKTKEEVEESFSQRVEVMQPIEFEINKGEFIGLECILNKSAEVYIENPSAEMKLMMEKIHAGTYY